jgi:hypothetical protein
MQQPAHGEPSPTSSSFAGLLAALAAPAPKVPSAWNDDDLEDDVATLSYESALRAHARYRTGNASDRSLTQPSDPGSIDILEAFSADALPAAAAATPPAAAPSSAQAEPWATHGPATALERNLKSASITIRMSKAECAQLHKRAAEAGLTLSAYLRSCTLEAETLRTLVKDALAQLRPATSKRNQVASASVRRSWLGWLLRFLPRWHSSQRIARA